MSEDSGAPSTRSTIPSTGSTTNNLRNHALRNESSLTSFPSTSSRDDLSHELPLSDTSHPLPPIPPLFADRVQPTGAGYGHKGQARPPSPATSFEVGDDLHLRQVSQGTESSGDWQSTSEPPPYPGQEQPPTAPQSLPVTQTIAYRQRPNAELPGVLQEPQSAVISNAADRNVSGSSNGQKESHSRDTSHGSYVEIASPAGLNHPFQYHHDKFDENTGIRLKDGASQRPHLRSSSSEPSQLLTVGNGSSTHLAPSNRTALPRPNSTYSSTSDLASRSRSPQRSPNHLAIFLPPVQHIPQIAALSRISISSTFHTLSLHLPRPTLTMCISKK